MRERWSSERLRDIWYFICLKHWFGIGDVARVEDHRLTRNWKDSQPRFSTGSRLDYLSVFASLLDVYHH